MKLPAYQTSPGLSGGLTDLIEGFHDGDRQLSPIRFISGYQGETDYETRLAPGRITLRYAKVPWRWSWKQEERYWNFDTEAEFQAQVNGAWGILHCGSDPVSPEVLAAFRAHHHPLMVTGFYNHETRLWELCEPSLVKLSYQSWQRTPRYAEFCREHNLAA